MFETKLKLEAFKDQFDMRCNALGEPSHDFIMLALNIKFLFCPPSSLIYPLPAMLRRVYRRPWERGKI